MSDRRREPRKRGNWTDMGEPEPPPKVDIHRVAVHEAGHAVVGTGHGLDLLWTRITEGTPEERHTDAGGCEWRGGTAALRLQIAERPIELGAMCFAGSLAEEHVLDWSEDGAEDQDRRLWRGAIGWSNDPSATTQWALQQAALEKGARDVETHREAILAVADALVAAPFMTLEGVAVRDLMGLG